MQTSLRTTDTDKGSIWTSIVPKKGCLPSSFTKASDQILDPCCSSIMSSSILCISASVFTSGLLYHFYVFFFLSILQKYTSILQDFYTISMPADINEPGKYVSTTLTFGRSQSVQMVSLKDHQARSCGLNCSVCMHLSLGEWDSRVRCKLSFQIEGKKKYLLIFTTYFNCIAHIGSNDIGGLLKTRIWSQKYFIFQVYLKKKLGNM